ncbi:hypothetical protein CEB3_c05100 [Peptococcaceae bacterium CEB3]|nr:hypothetical protein CEB3_c05100 [Peptococcaceae bacterium CEB3]
MAKKISVIIPVYNEGTLVETCYQRVVKVLWDTKYAYEILFVDDGSTDGNILDTLVDPHVKVIHLARNFGQQIAITAGLDAASGDAVIIMDADLQDPPELIPRMLELWEQGAHIVYGQRLSRQGETWRKKVTANLYYRLLSRLTDVRVPVDAGDFRLMDRQVVDVLCQMREHSRYLRGLSAWAGFKQVPLAYERQGRAAGETKYTGRKMMHLALDGVFSLSYLPLRLITYSGLLTLILSLFMKPHVLMFCIGLQGTVAGAVLGAYLKQVVENTRNRPLYTVVETAEKVGSSAGRLQRKDAS